MKSSGLVVEGEAEEGEIDETADDEVEGVGGQSGSLGEHEASMGAATHQAALHAAPAQGMCYFILEFTQWEFELIN